MTQPDVDMAIKLMDFSFETLEKIDKDEAKTNRRDRKFTYSLFSSVSSLTNFFFPQFVEQDASYTNQ